MKPRAPFKIHVFRKEPGGSLCLDCRQAGGSPMHGSDGFAEQFWTDRDRVREAALTLEKLFPAKEDKKG
jgi:hypothetical protein